MLADKAKNQSGPRDLGGYLSKMSSASENAPTEEREIEIPGWSGTELPEEREEEDGCTEMRKHKWIWAMGSPFYKLCFALVSLLSVPASLVH